MTLADDTVQLEDDLPTRITDRNDNVLVRHDTLNGRDAFALRLPGDREVWLVPEEAEHALLGPCDGIHDGVGGVIALAARSDWRHPRRIPAVDVPGALPPGAGTAILNLLARAARHAGVASLRYVGPYPTAALFDTLRSSFVADGDLAAFTHAVEATAFAGRSVEHPMAFRPAPHAWHRESDRIWIQGRAELERVYVDGAPYDRSGPGPRMLVRDEGGWRAEVRFVGAVHAVRVRVDEDGHVLDGPHPLPTEPLSLAGGEVPRPLREILRQALVIGAPVLLRPAMDAVLTEHRLVWDDTGDRAATHDGTTIRIHAALGERLADLPAAVALAAFIQAVEPLAQRAAQRRLLAQ